MANNSEIPDGWAMSDELAKKVSEVLNKKPVSPGDELADALDELARDIALIEPDPKDWGWYVTYLLEKMEEEAQRRGSQAEFIRMLESLKMDIDN
jgi:predicted hydrolase (HD superfamily)